MATRDKPPGTFDADLAELDKATARVKRARAALASAESDARPIVAKALASGLTENVTGFRAEVQRRSPFSAPVVRAIGDEAGIPPDERYVRAAKPSES